MTIRFDGQVAIVTGAGNGLGRTHALELAKRGAKVVVNDLGGSVDGSGGGSDASQAVVAEIEAAGGEAIAHGANVTNAEQVADMVAKTMEKWGRIDILVNNAGILRDKSFAKMTLDDFKLVVDVHLIGSTTCTKAVWDIMREQNYGRIVMTTSSSGLYGNFGQANYGAAKLGVVGLMNTLVIEGAKNGIHINTLAPCAASRMTEGLMPPEILAMLKPEYVTQGLIALVDKDAPNRRILETGAGCYSVARIVESKGISLQGADITAENVRARWDELSDEATSTEYKTGAEPTQNFFNMIQAAMGK
jgi:NAD(P)-dependent dehydrogenase (short-subunit alcohol dehydrogenase family)